MEKCPEFRFKWRERVSEHSIPLFVDVDTLECLCIYIGNYLDNIH